MMPQKKLPELLAPAGTLQALQAALDGGADAVYFGGTAFNARQRAENFTPEQMREGIRLCHAFGAKAYITLNTLLTDRELPRALEVAEEAYLAGADALILADLGLAKALHRHLPDLDLHASTQCAGHNTAAAEQLKQLGFSRMVLARETSAQDIRSFLQNSSLEAEVFVHGALCVSHSGQCLFSSLVGGRSGNRGECAQPCRLPDARGRYPLSLKDLCLARHIPALIEMGVHSLKIEGRLKSPAYVREVTAAWRRLLDEGRGATDREMEALAAVFSRGGFTDAYFTRKIDKKMLGFRSDADKEQSRTLEPFTKMTRTVPLDLHLTMRRDQPLTLRVQTATQTATVTGEPPLIAERAPMDEAAVRRNLCKLGGTPYTAAQVRIDLDEGLMLPLSRLNALRRAALDQLCEVTRQLPTHADPLQALANEAMTAPDPAPASARFENAAQITASAVKAFAVRYLPLHAFSPPANGVVLPPVIFDSERQAVKDLLKKAVQAGAAHALVGNVGHLSLALEAGLIPHADFRLNITNQHALSTVLAMGFADALLSPELTLPQIRDIRGKRDVIIYGRIPLMLLEKCAGIEVGSCQLCAAGQNLLTDRRGEQFPLLRLPDHRNLLLNSRPTVMSDRRQELERAGIGAGHFLFTTESPAQVDRVLQAYAAHTPLDGAKRRI